VKPPPTFQLLEEFSSSEWREYKNIIYVCSINHERARRKYYKKLPQNKKYDTLYA